MKKIAILLVGFLIVSCSNEERDVSENKSKLVSVRENTYMDDGEYTYRTFYFNDDKLISIASQWVEDHDEYTYNDKGLVDKIIEYKLTGGIYMTTTYAYDNKGRITEFHKKSGPVYPFFVDSKYTFNYLSDKIVYTILHESGNTETAEIAINSSNSIIKQNIPDSQYSYVYNYLNGNMINSSLLLNNISSNSGLSTYSYTNLKNEYNYKRFVFGKEWKLNSLLNSLYLSKGRVLSDLSENLISEHTTTNTDETNLDVTVFKSKYEYTFNAQNQIEKQTRIYTKTTNGILELTIKYELLYTYE